MQVKPRCTFCGIVAGEIPSTTIAETDRAIAFMDINPVTDGHALVVPREHASDLLDIPHDDLAACALLSQEIARRAKDRLGADGVNLLNCSGADAWQTEFHFHVHVIPQVQEPARQGPVHTSAVGSCAGRPGRDRPNRNSPLLTLRLVAEPAD